MTDAKPSRFAKNARPDIRSTKRPVLVKKSFKTSVLPVRTARTVLKVASAKTVLSPVAAMPVTDMKPSRFAKNAKTDIRSTLRPVLASKKNRLNATIQTARTALKVA